MVNGISGTMAVNLRCMGGIERQLTRFALEEGCDCFALEGLAAVRAVVPHVAHRRVDCEPLQVLPIVWQRQATELPALKDSLNPHLY